MFPGTESQIDERIQMAYRGSPKHVRRRLCRFSSCSSAPEDDTASREKRATGYTAQCQPSPMPQPGGGFFMPADILAHVAAERGLDGFPRRARADAR
jgi:hypothetical protein